jgi:hypothetical protein
MSVRSCTTHPRLALLDDLVLWHRVDEIEAATRQVNLGLGGTLVLAVAPSPAIALVGEHEVPLSIWTGPGEIALGRGGTVPLPDGWAPELAAGDLVALALDGSRLRLHTAEDPALAQRPPAGSAEVAALGEALTQVGATDVWRLQLLCDRQRDPDGQWVLDVAHVARTLLADHGAALRALHRLPLREAIARAGLTARSAVVGGPGVEQQQLETYLVGRMVAGGVDPRSVTMFEACGIAWGALAGPMTEDDDEAATVRVLRQMLDDPSTAEAIVDFLDATHRGVVSEAERRLRPVRAAHPHDPGPAWVHAATLLDQGRPHDARDALEAVVDELDDEGTRQWAEPVMAAGHLRAIAGDLGGALALLRRVDAPQVHQLDGWVRPAPTVGRNERCPCASGRKAKHCCLRAPAPLTAEDRVRLVWWKLREWTWAEHALVVLAGHLVHGDDASSRACCFATLLDAHMLEGGGVGAALDEVGALLPEVEQDVALRWRAGRHSLWTVASDGDDRGQTWVDVGTGERATVVGHLAPACTPDRPPVGAHVLAALLPGAEGHHLVGHTVAVSDADVERVRTILNRWLDPATFGALLRVLQSGELSMTS